MLVSPRARPAARVHGRLGAGPHHLRRRRSFSGAGAPQSLNSDEAGPARRLRDSDQDRGAGPGSRIVLRPPPRHPLLKVTLKRSFCAGSAGLEIPCFPAPGVNPSLLQPMRAIVSQPREYYRLSVSVLDCYSSLLNRVHIHDCEVWLL